MPLLAWLSLCLLGLVGCQSIKAPIRADTLPLTAGNLHQLSGTYANFPAEREGAVLPPSSSLWRQITYEDDSSPAWPECLVELRVLSARLLRATLRYRGGVVGEETIKGELKDGVFSLRRQVRVGGVPFIYFFHSDNKSQLALSEAGDLYVDHARGSYGNIFLFSAGSSDDVSSRFERRGAPRAP